MPYKSLSILVLTSTILSISLLSFSEELTSSDRMRLINELYSRPIVHNSDIELIINTKFPNRKAPSEAEIQAMIEEKLQESISESPHIPNYYLEESRANLGKIIRENIALKHDRTLHKRIIKEGNHYVSMINRFPQLDNLPETFDDIYINTRKKGTDEFRGCSIDNLHKAGQISNGGWKEYIYHYTGAGQNGQIFGAFKEQKERDLISNKGRIKQKFWEFYDKYTQDIRYDIQRGLKWEGKVVDRIEISDKNSKEITAVIILDSANYRHLYYESLMTNGKLTYEVRNDDYHRIPGYDWDFPFYCRLVYNNSREPEDSEINEITFLNVKLNTEIDPAVFKFDTYIDDSYRVQDISGDQSFNITPADPEEQNRLDNKFEVK